MGELNLVPVPGTSPVNRTKTAVSQWAPPAVVGQQAPETVVSTSPAKKRKGMGTLQLFGREKLDEETALLHKAHLSPSLGENELAKRWEFASVRILVARPRATVPGRWRSGGGARDMARSGGGHGEACGLRQGGST